jgi:hypothetical protein
MSLALLMIFIAELRRSVDTAIPEIINFLNDSDTRLATTKALLRLSDRGKTANLLIFALLMKIIAEFRPSIAIPKIVTLLKDSDIEGCNACATALSKSSEHGKTGILPGLALLMSIIAEFRALIDPTVLDMVKTINGGDSNNHVAYINALSKFSQQGKTAN